MNERVLIIEDTKEISKWMEKICGRLISKHTDAAFDNQEARAFLEKNFYSFIFCDLFIPGGDPVDSLIASGQINSCVLIVSASDEGNLIKNQRRLLDAGFRRVEYLQKPICLDDLKAIL